MTIDREIDETTPLEGVDQLVDWFRAGEKAPAEFRVGLEHEKLIYRRDNLAPAAYPEIVELLLQLSKEGWEPRPNVQEPIALERDGSWVSLEPGSQLELSGRPFRSIHESAALLQRHAEELDRACAQTGLAVAQLGFRPFVTADQVPRTPRQRHAIMREYLPHQGKRSLDMMFLTASAQANFDYATEEDFVRKLRLAQRISPVVAALFANSPIRGDAAAGADSTRVETWFDVDPDRCGFLPFVFDDDMGYRRYAEWVLDLPMILVRRAGAYRAMSGISLRDFVSHGVDGEQASMADFETHLSMAFPEVRAKRWIELRSADAAGVEGALALGALCKGLLYDESSLKRAEELTAGLTSAKLLRELQRAAAQRSLAGHVGEWSLGELARQLCGIAREGLARQAVLDENGRDETIHLEFVEAIAASGRSLASRLLERFGSGPYDARTRRAILASGVGHDAPAEKEGVR